MSIELSRYVFRYGETLFNSMSGESLRADAPEQELRERLFLAGQEEEALEARLFRRPKSVVVKIIPTWECNLRCKHCSVLHRLRRRDGFSIDPGDVVRFMSSVGDHYGVEKFGLFFIGGECLLRTRECLAIADAVVASLGRERIKMSLTTNLSLDLDLDAVRLLSMMDSFDVSLDGTEKQHNWQRKAHKEYGEINPYRKTFFNIMRLVKVGLADKIKVQAAVQDEVADEAERLRFFQDMARIGVAFENITYGGVHPTKLNPKVDETYANYLKSTTPWRTPCCDYRYMTHFSFNPDGTLDQDYFFNIKERASPNISDFGRSYGIRELEAGYEDKIRRNMSVMKDEVCKNHCPVLAYCWGRCHNNGFVTDRPSLHCDMRGLEVAVRKSMSCPLPRIEV